MGRKVCQCHPRDLEKLNIKWRTRPVPGWYIRTGFGLRTIAVCPVCSGDLSDRSRPDEWFDSDEYLARMAAIELWRASRGT